MKALASSTVSVPLPSLSAAGKRRNHWRNWVSDCGNATGVINRKQVHRLTIFMNRCPLKDVFITTMASSYLLGILISPTARLRLLLLVVSFSFSFQFFIRQDGSIG
jgi:hypothetical protein